MMNKISESWDAMVKSAGSGSAARQQAFALYVDKYSKGSKSGEVAYAGGAFRPGEIYTFVYVDDKRENQRPLILSMGGFSRGAVYYETGIDLCLIPPDFRSFILDRFAQFYREDLAKNLKLVGDGKTPRPLQFGWREATRSLGRSGWQTAAKAYDRRKIRQVAIVDYSDWGACVGMLTGAVKNVVSVYQDYVKKAQEKIAAQPTWEQAKTPTKKK
jgi:hypothetical protein